MRRAVLWLAISVAWVPAGATLAQTGEGMQEPHRLSDTRLLRRVTVSLLRRPPTFEEYEALLAEPEERRRDFIREHVHELLRSVDFVGQLREWGHEYLRVGSYNYASSGPYFAGTHAADLKPCPEGSLHEGAWGLLNNYASLGDPWELCDDAAALVRDVEPWWAPGTTVRVLGSVATEVREVDGVDCGRIGKGLYSVFRRQEGCSCGPNLVYCGRRDAQRFSPRGYEGDNFDPTSIRRAVFEEPARLFAHVVASERPFSDLVLGTYTVVNKGLRFFYMRQARQNSDNAFLDDVRWWRDHTDPYEWREVPLPELHPDLLEDRSYRFDPRVDAGQPEGIPAAGVLTTIGANEAFPRERVRAARWLEVFACREFTPPPGDAEFNPYERDPFSEGTCQHCHQLIDPAAIHFKRMFGPGLFLAGVGTWSLENMRTYSGFRPRAESAYIHDTFLTPVGQPALEQATDRRLLDFLPGEATLLGQPGDGTIGPLGFARALIDSGEFDRCAVRRVYERFVGRRLARGQDDALIRELVEEFVAGDRNVLALVESIMLREEILVGW